jgi:threonine/homoserine/homoserine lactone efflux protein
MEPWIIAFGIFALSMSATPGPNNVMVTASGANFGFRRSLPHMMGISLGFPVMLFGVGIGLGAILAIHPKIQYILQIMGAAYLLVLAWRIVRAGDVKAGAKPARPMSFLEAAAFQWLNPKAWLIAVGALGTYAPASGSLIATLPMMGLIFVMVCLPSVALWTLIGTGFGRLLTTPRAMRSFNICMALLLVASLALAFV